VFLEMGGGGGRNKTDNLPKKNFENQNKKQRTK
jgi:hypothetical protein